MHVGQPARRLTVPRDVYVLAAPLAAMASMASSIVASVGTSAYEPFERGRMQQAGPEASGPPPFPSASMAWTMNLLIVALWTMDRGARSSRIGRRVALRSFISLTSAVSRIFVEGGSTAASFKYICSTVIILSVTGIGRGANGTMYTSNSTPVAILREAATYGTSARPVVVT